MQNLLKNNKDKGIKIAFVSACKSEEIGEIFHNSGIPIVIAVNSQSFISDEICLIFSRHFYMQLLEGNTVQEAFDDALSTVKASDINCFSCCCAHLHDPGCKWLKYCQVEGNDGHELHSGQCNCKGPGNRHDKNCKIYIKFMKTLRDFQDPDEPQEENEQLAAWGFGQKQDINYIIKQN